MCVYVDWWPSPIARLCVLYNLSISTFWPWHMRKQGGIMTRLLGNLGAGHKEAFETINHGNDGGMNHPTWGYQEVYLSQNHHQVYECQLKHGKTSSQIAVWKEAYSQIPNRQFQAANLLRNHGISWFYIFFNKSLNFE